MLHNLENIDNDNLYAILLSLCPEDILALRLADKNLYECHFQLLWKKKFALHFPQHYSQFEKLEQVDWYIKFLECYQTEYKDLPPLMRRLFSLIKEGQFNHSNDKKINLIDPRYFNEFDKMFSNHTWVNLNLKYFYSFVINGYHEFVEWMLKFHSDFLSTMLSDLTPLHYATMKGHLDVVKVLLNHGAMIDATTKKNETALHLGIFGQHMDIAIELVDRGANIHASANIYPDNSDVRPADMAYNSLGQELLNRMLDKHPNDIFDLAQRAIHRAGHRREYQQMHGLWKKRPDIFCQPIILDQANEEVKRKLSLLNYLYLRSLGPNYKTKITLFGKEIGFGCPSEEKISAANALRHVIFDGDLPSTLNKHERALANGELGRIRGRLRR